MYTTVEQKVTGSRYCQLCQSGLCDHSWSCKQGTGLHDLLLSVIYNSSDPAQASKQPGLECQGNNPPFLFRHRLQALEGKRTEGEESHQAELSHQGEGAQGQLELPSWPGTQPLPAPGS